MLNSVHLFKNVYHKIAYEFITNKNIDRKKNITHILFKINDLSNIIVSIKGKITHFKPAGG